MLKDYNIQIQQLFLEMMLEDAQSYVRVANIYNSENFDRSLRPAAEFIKQHTDTHKTMPDRAQISATTGIKLLAVPDLNDGHFDWLLTEFEQFTKRQELERAILKAADLLEKGEFDPVEKLIKDAVQISLTKDMGTDYFADPVARLNKYFNSGGQVSTGWPQMDRLLFGGFSRGELNIFAGGSGSGKSLVMMNIALNWLQAGLSGVYITLELSEELTSLRTDAMLTNMSTKDIRKDINTTELKVRMVAKKAGNYQVKGLPAQSNINDIRAYLKEYQIQTSKRVDFVMIDYLDLLMPVSAKVSPNDLFVKDKFVSEELRNLSKELGILMVTASQLNRCFSLDTNVVSNGQTIKIKDVAAGDWLESESGPVQVTEILPIVKQLIFEITTKSGKKIKVSAKHKFPTPTGLKTLEDGLQIGNFLRSRTRMEKQQREYNCKMREFFEETFEWDEIVSIEYAGIEDTIDINVTGDRLFWANDILAHNSAVEEIEFDHSHISGGISKINTADNVFGIFTSRAMKERGKYQIQCMKSRSSTGVGQKIDLEYNIETMRITDEGGDDGDTRFAKPSIMDSIRAKSSVGQAVSEQDGTVSTKWERPAGKAAWDYPVVTADVQSTKLKGLLNKIKSS